MPTASVVDFWPAGSRLTPFINPEEAMASMQHVKLPASVTYAAGTVLGEVTATPGLYKAYATGNSDGSQNARVILEYKCVTDASGNINTDEWGVGQLTAPVFTTGWFKTEDLVGLDAGAVTGLGGSLVEGTVTSGLLRF